MTEYLKPRFTVSVGGKSYGDGWDAIFRCREIKDEHKCRLKRDHDGEHVDGDYHWS